MEHVQDDKKAMGECYRVLKNFGIAIINVPLFENEKAGNRQQGRLRLK